MLNFATESSIKGDFCSLLKSLIRNRFTSNVNQKSRSGDYLIMKRYNIVLEK